VQTSAEPAALADSSPGVGARPLDRWLGHLLSTACVLLLTAEIVLLLIGVVARYVFAAPQVWIDELTSLLFLWLAMLGAVLALRSGSHMRMTALITRAPPRLRQGLNSLAVAAPVMFLLCTLLPAVRYVQNEQIVSLTTMDISLAWRAAAMPAGIGLMLLSMLLRLRRPSMPEAVSLIALLALAAGAMASGTGFRTLGNLNLLIFFVGVAATTVLAGIPIAFSFGLSTLAYLALATRIPVSVLLSRMDAGMSHPVLLAVPLFIFLGLLIEMTGMAAVMVAFLSNLLGHVRGGLSYVLIAAMYLVSGISGSKAADMAAIAPALFPEMVKRGVPRGELVALLAATGSQTETIPPSLILITIGSVTGISIASLFAGGGDPGRGRRDLSWTGRLATGTWAWFGGAARHARRDPTQLGHIDAGARVAVRDPCRDRRRCGNRDRGLDDRDRLCLPRRFADLPPL
jgi:TRAP-type C4-dicarboxylate transport system permease small subunit